MEPVNRTVIQFVWWTILNPGEISLSTILNPGLLCCTHPSPVSQHYRTHPKNILLFFFLILSSTVTRTSLEDKVKKEKAASFICWMNFIHANISLAFGVYEKICRQMFCIIASFVDKGFSWHWCCVAFLIELDWQSNSSLIKQAKTPYIYVLLYLLQTQCFAKHFQKYTV